MNNFSFQNKILLFLIFWVAGYSLVLRYYYQDAYQKQVHDIQAQVDRLTEETLMLRSQLDNKPAPHEQPQEKAKGEPHQKPQDKPQEKPKPTPKPTSSDTVDYRSMENQYVTAKEFLEKTSGKDIVKYFHDILTESSTKLTLRERKRAKMDPNLPIQPWLFKQDGIYESVPYQVTIPEHEPPPPAELKNVTLPPKAVTEEINRICGLLESKGHTKLAAMFRKCYPNTLETTTSILEDGTTYVITGDIDLMWLRDSSAQVHQYLSDPNLVRDPEMQRIVEGMIKRQSLFIQKSPYGSSFRLKLRPNSDDDLGSFHVSKARNIYVSMHNYELDSLCYHVALSYQWWKASGRTQIFTEEWQRVVHIIVALWVVEQHHADLSPYRYKELTRDGGKWSSTVSYTGMTWTAFRPSDDQTQYGYLIPSNMFAVVALQYIEEIAKEIYQDSKLEVVARKLRTEIDDGIHKHAVISKEGFGKVYAYEVSGSGATNFMDDANVPSLLSIEYLGYKSPHDPTGEITANTRKFIMSSANPYFYSGSYASGIGSPHTPSGNIWPMSLVMQGLTSRDADEVMKVFDILQKTDAGTDFMHESFNAGNPSSYTRYWFAWANSLFSELVLKHLNLLTK